MIRLPEDPLVLVVAGLAVLWLLTAVLAWRSARKLRRELTVVATKAAGSVDDLDELFDTVHNLQITTVELATRATAQFKPQPRPSVKPVPVTVGTNPGLDWVDIATGPQPIPDPVPPTVMIPRAPAREETGPATRHNPSEPKTAALSLRDLIARLEAERDRETE